MKIYIPKIQLKQLQESELDKYYSSSSEEYGEDLVRRVAAKLSLTPSWEKYKYLSDGGLFHSHRVTAALVCTFLKTNTQLVKSMTAWGHIQLLQLLRTRMNLSRGLPIKMTKVCPLWLL
tara:strand:- start:1461 stop:1817 length:357 start_codon:yes stop_codon:yes gene_type:complete